MAIALNLFDINFHQIRQFVYCAHCPISRTLQLWKESKPVKNKERT